MAPRTKTNIDTRHQIAQAMGLPTPSKRLNKALNAAAKAGEQDAINREAGLVPYVEVDQETAYGATVRLSRSIRVF
jgi:hypothetical protein